MSRGNNRAINVKIPTKKVIESLSKALAKREKEVEDYPKLQAAYNKAYKKWTEDTFNMVKDAKPDEVEVFDWRGNSTVKVTYKVTDFIDKPQEPNNPDNYRFKDELEELRNAIRILEMTEEEHVSTSTYNSIAKFL